MTKLYLTVDVEPDPWTGEVPLAETKCILEQLHRREQKITFFVTGKIVESHRDLISSMAEEGHEIGLHGYSHLKITSLEILQTELKKSKDIVKEFGIQGFRAPQAHLPPGSFEVLKQYGFTYDSSTYFPKRFSAAGIMELPVLSLGQAEECGLPFDMMKSLLSKVIPIGSGLFSGICPKLQLRMAKNSNEAVIFFHPWQLSRHSSIKSLTSPYLWPYLPSAKSFLEEATGKFDLQKLDTLL